MFKKIDPTVIKETSFIMMFSAIFSLLMQSVFLIVNKWDYTVLLGNLFGFAAISLNFLLMGITVQKAVLKEPEEAKKFIRMSQSLRLFFMFIVALVGYLVPVFNTLAVIIPFLFPRIAIAIRTFKIKK